MRSHAEWPRRVIAAMFAMIAAVAWEIADFIWPPPLSNRLDADLERRLRALEDKQRWQAPIPRFDDDDTQPYKPVR